MVLFREDEKRMIEQERREKLARRTPLERWIRRLIKIGLIGAVIVAISLTLLAGLGGSNAALQKGIEDYLSQTSGMKAEITEFNKLEFFPNVEFDAKSITFRRRGEDRPAMTVGSIKFSTGFFDLMFSRRQFENLTLKGLEAEPGIWGVQPLRVDELALKDKAVDGRPALVATGAYGDDAFDAHLIMRLRQKDKNSVFTLPDESAFQLNLAGFSAQGNVYNRGWNGTGFEISRLGPVDKTLSGTIDVKKLLTKSRVRADIIFGSSNLRTDVKARDLSFKGDIVFPVLDPEDLDILAAIFDFVAGLLTTGGPAEIDFYGWDADLDVAVKKLAAGENNLGALAFPVTVNNQEMTWGPLSGSINGGRLSGKIDLDARTLPALFDARVTLKSWDFGHYQKARFGRENVSGTANINIALQGKGKTYEELAHSLKGEAVLIAGEGEFASAALNIWGGGLVNAMIPNLTDDSMTTLNCMIADFKVENGIAKPDPLFIDTARVTVIGAGEINIPDDRINLKLEPKAKNPALLDVASAVTIKGPILSPQIGTDTFSLFEKLGGLALGFVNPAFLAFSMTDLGLTENHPCHKFIGAPPGKEEVKEELQDDARMAGGEEQQGNQPEKPVEVQGESASEQDSFNE